MSLTRRAQQTVVKFFMTIVLPTQYFEAVYFLQSSMLPAIAPNNYPLYKKLMYN